ncbi:hypothetical protein IJG96_01420 [Candidatus Saccharibacteria bacterium]|nr:hypothetical protein [Candidatus Saccharibacteria bacterium]
MFTSDSLNNVFVQLFDRTFIYGVLITLVAAIMVFYFGRNNRRLGAVLVALWLVIGGVSFYHVRNMIKSVIPENYIFKGVEFSTDAYASLKDAIDKGEPINFYNVDPPKPDFSHNVPEPDPAIANDPPATSDFDPDSI